MSAEVKATSNLMPWPLSLRPASRASATPLSVRSTSRQPVNRFFRFQSLWPCRTSTRRRSVIALLSHTLEIFQPQHIHHRIEPGLLCARPQRGMQRAAREDHAVLGLVHQFDALGRTGEDHAVLAHHTAAAQRGKADVAGLAYTGVAVAAGDPVLVELD